MQKFETLFEEALRSDGSRYRQIRCEIVAAESGEVAGLESRIRDPDWRVRLQAEIFKGWRTDSERYEYIRRVAGAREDTLWPQNYMTGKPPVEVSARVLADLGPGYLPALLEIISKEPDVLTYYAFSVCAKVAKSWNDPRAVPVYRDLLMDHSVDAAYRESSIQSLFDLNAEQLYEDLMSVYEDENNPLELRATSLAAIGAVKDERSIPFLESTLKNPKIQLDFRCAAADGFGETEDPAVVEFLTRQYAVADNSDLKESIIGALGMIEDPRAVRSLRSIQDTESDPELLETIEETLEDLKHVE